MKTISYSIRLGMLFPLLSVIVCGCKQEKLSPGKFMQWVDDYDHGLVKQEIVGKVKYTVAYRPWSYQLARRLASGDSFALKSSEARNHCFIVKMEPVDGRTPVLTIDAAQKEEPFMRINYYLEQAQQDIQLLEGADTLKVQSYIYERLYNVSPAQTLVIGFSQHDSLGSKDIDFIMEDKALSTGKMTFHFSKEILKHIPQLITNEAL